jgi:glycosyltransferase involved in cell wall biosynthesis
VTSQDISVVICAYTEARWRDLVAAVRSVQAQSSQPREIIVVVDHNPSLLDRVRTGIQGVTAVENLEHKGLSGARNTGATVAQGMVVAFLDDDAIAEPDWLARLAECYADPRVVGVGGKIEPLWLSACPGWFPAEFHWVVGCTYRGMPTEGSPVRNLIGANMSVQRAVLLRACGFRDSFGCNHDSGETAARRTGPKWLHHSAGDEETEFCIRVTQRWPDTVWFYTPMAIVRHRVPAQRASWRYFLWRCYDEGLGKAALAHLRGAHAGLASERTYTLQTLPRGILHGLGDAMVRGEASGLGRATAIAGGLAVTATGYLVGRCRMRFVPPRGMPVAAEHVGRDRDCS